MGQVHLTDENRSNPTTSTDTNRLVAGEPSLGNSLNRRQWSQQVLAASALASLTIPTVHAGGDDRLRIGLVGCGGRGSGAVGKALKADPNTVLVALGDLFPDCVESARTQLKSHFGDQIAVTPEKCFSGFDNYFGVIEASDVVLLATPPHFRPIHLQAAVEAGKHVFVEKPVAVDAPGVRQILQACEAARAKGLSIVSGLCYRYHPGVREWVQRIQNGAIGRLVTLQANYNAGALWVKRRQPQWSDMEWQCRNWLYFTWLSGDHIVEQHIHSLDKAAWILGDRPPICAVGLGGRQVRTQPEFGNIFDHHAVVFEYENGVRLYSYCRQQANTASEDSDIVFGTDGTAINRQTTIQMIQNAKQEKVWQYRGRGDDMYLEEHRAHFASIRNGQALNNGDYMAHSTMLAVMGRMATYTGQKITWQQALNSTERLGPTEYVLGAHSVEPVAMPGQTTSIL